MLKNGRSPFTKHLSGTVSVIHSTHRGKEYTVLYFCQTPKELHNECRQQDASKQLQRVPTTLFNDRVVRDRTSSSVRYDPNRKVSTEPRKRSYCHLLAEKGTQSPVARYGLWTYTSESSFLFFSSFFSFSSSWVMSPFFTRSSFSLTWSSIFSTWGPTHNQHTLV